MLDSVRLQRYRSARIACVWRQKTLHRNTSPVLGVALGQYIPSTRSRAIRLPTSHAWSQRQSGGWVSRGPHDQRLRSHRQRRTRMAVWLLVSLITPS